MIYDVSALLWFITCGRLANCVYTNLYEAQMSSSCLIGTSPTASIPSRGRRSGSSHVYKLTPDMQAPAKQVVLTNTKNKIQRNTMLTEGILDQATSPKQHRHCRCPRCASWDNRWSDDWRLFVFCATTQTCVSYSFTTTILGANVATVPRWSCHHQWRNELWYIFVPPWYNIVT